MDETLNFSTFYYFGQTYGLLLLGYPLTEKTSMKVNSESPMNKPLITLGTSDTLPPFNPMTNKRGTIVGFSANRNVALAGRNVLSKKNDPSP